MRLPFVIFIAPLIGLFASCGGKVVVDSSPPENQGGGGRSGGQSSGGQSSGGQGGSAGVCGGKVGLPCSPDEYCDFPHDSCGAFDSSGVCKKRPPFCDDGGPSMPVCGCNGKVYAYECDASLAGQDRGPNSACLFNSTYFACGPVVVCDGTQAYCQQISHDISSEPDTFTCVPFPICSNGSLNCSCLKKEPCSTQCITDANGNLTLSCTQG